MSRRLLLTGATVLSGGLIAGCGTASTAKAPTPAAAAPAPAAPTTVTGQAEPSTAPAAAGPTAFDQQLVQAASETSAAAGIILPTAGSAKSAVAAHHPKQTIRPSALKSTPPPAGSPTSSGGSSSGGGSAPGAPQTVTVIRTVTVPGPPVVKTVAPDVPVGAWMPSIRPALALPSFVVTGGNIGCVLQDGGARCDIAHRVWTPPVQPTTCGFAWGQGITVSGTTRATFVCAADSVLTPSSNLLPPGDDDHVGNVTCQVRRIGVTCFTTAGHGFTISRTGYTIF